MADIPFFEKLARRSQEINSVLCVGLDPHGAQLPEGDRTAEAALRFCTRLIEATSDVAVAYKPNAAFFEAFGADGANALKRVVAAVPDGIPVLLDCKRGDIGSTSKAYAEAAYGVYGAHGVTLSPYMGHDSLDPFLKEPYTAKGAFVLCKTSNPGSQDFQALQLHGQSGQGKGEALYELVARRVAQWSAERNNMGLVVGATDTAGISGARRAAPSLWILAPGLGAQGGDLESALEAGMWRSGDGDGGSGHPGGGIIFPVSRGISKASDPAAAAREWCDRINAARATLLGGGGGGGGGGESGGLAGRKRKRETGQEGDAPQGETEATSDASAFLSLALSRSVLRFGSFTLKSGRVSPYFFNAGLFSTGSDLLQVGRFYARAIVRWGLEFDVIFGPAYKGITLAAAIAIALADQHGRDVPYTYNRKEKKDHGEGGSLVGASIDGKRVLVVDDVITAGTAIRESMGILGAANARAVGVLVALDRQEKGPGGASQSAIQSVAAEYGIPVRSVATLVQLQGFVAARGTAGDEDLLQRIAAYRAEHGVC